MKKVLGLLWFFVLVGCSTLQGVFDSISSGLSNVSAGSSDNNEPSGGNPSFVRQKVDYTIRDSVDKIGNLYISYQSQLPSVMTFLNGDGSVTVCSSDEYSRITYIYEYSINLELSSSFNIPAALTFQTRPANWERLQKTQMGTIIFSMEPKPPIRILKIWL
jgi:hypothetical protein